MLRVRVWSVHVAQCRIISCADEGQQGSDGCAIILEVILVEHRVVF